MRIAHISDCYLPRTGGIEAQVRGLAVRQAHAGDDVSVITATPGHGAAIELLEGVQVTRVTMRLPGDLPLHPRTAHHVEQVLERWRPDVVHVHVGVVSPFAWGALRAIRRQALPTVVTVHGVWGPLARPAVRVLEPAVGWSSQHLLLTAVSSVAASAVARSLGRPVGVLANGIDPAAWRGQAPAAASAVEPATLRLVSVMRLAPRKRVGALLRIVAEASEVLAGRVDVRLTVVGDGPERARAERRARARGVRATFTGRLPRAGILAAFAESDVFVQPSVRESFGIAALEARTFGLPVVARSQAGTRDFIEDGVNGLLAADDAAMAQAVVTLALDQGLRERIRRENADQPPAQTWDAVLSEAADFYRRVRSSSA